MDTAINLALGVLGVVDLIAKIIKDYDKPLAQDVLGELVILQNVLAESSVMVESLQNDAPYSAGLALERCQNLAKDMDRWLHHMYHDSSKASSKMKRSIRIGDHNTERLKHIFASFKSAVLLFRDIATNATTHDLLLLVAQSDFDPKQAPSQRRASRAPSVVGVPPPHVVSAWPPPQGSTLERPPLEKRRSRSPSVVSMPAPNISMDGTGEALERAAVIHSTRRMSPTEKLSLFDATISVISEELIGPSSGGSPDSAHYDPLSVCICGRRRVGRWFPVRGKFDSGANANFISDSVISRAGLDRFVVQNKDEMAVKMFGVSFKFDKIITLSWQMRDEEKSCTNDFWVASNTEEFDLIIGEQWMMKHGYQVFDVTKTSRMTQLFGLLKLGRKSKEQRARESGTAADGREEALRIVSQMSTTSAVIPGVTQQADGPNLDASPPPQPPRPSLPLLPQINVNGVLATPLGSSNALDDGDPSLDISGSSERHTHQQQ